MPKKTERQENSQKSAPQVPDSAAETAERVVEAIIAIDGAIKQLNASRLKRRAVLLLLSDQTGVGIGAIAKVLDGMTELRQTYLKQ